MSLPPVSDVLLTSSMFILLLEAAPGRPEPVRRPGRSWRPRWPSLQLCHTPLNMAMMADGK
jgi:hypothetical protein